MIGAAVLATAGWRASGAANALAELVEAALDMHIFALGERLGIPRTGSPADLGRAITAQLRAPTRPV